MAPPAVTPALSYPTAPLALPVAPAPPVAPLNHPFASRSEDTSVASSSSEATANPLETVALDDTAHVGSQRKRTQTEKALAAASGRGTRGGRGVRGGRGARGGKMSG